MFTQVQACRLWAKARLPLVACAPWVLSPFVLTCVALSQQTSATSVPAGQSQVRAHSDVVFSDGLLTVVAGDTSLNSLIHEIGSKAGIKITGRTADDPVFGHYGPERPEAILTTLLDGSGSNILLVHDGSNHTTELILTPRTGGPTPPNPSAQFASENTSQPAPQYQQPNPVQGQQQRPPYGGPRGLGRTGVGGVEQNPAATAPSSTSEQVVFPPIDGTTPAATATTTPLSTDKSTGTAKTPQQIFEQLQKLRQQQSQSNQTPDP